MTEEFVVPHAFRVDSWAVVRGLFASAACLIALAGPLATAPAYADMQTARPAAPLVSTLASLESTSTTPTPTPEATPTAVFAGNASWGVRLNLPAQPADLLAVGFHQADPSKKTLVLKPATACVGIYNPTRTRRLLNATLGIKLFQQALRGRGTSNFSAADCAVKPKSTILSPVTGTVMSVKTYWLYGRYRDVRLEIRPDGVSRKITVVVLHIQDPKVKAGWRVVGGVTPIATVRHFRFASEVNRYLSVKYADHTHVQLNRK